MSTFYQPVKKAPLKYITSDGEYKKINVVAIKGVNISNSFDIPYVRGAVGLFNAIISRMMYFTDKDVKKRAQEKIYFPAWQISKVINRCESQSYNIIRSLERILDIHVSRAHEKAGANVFRLSERVYEFLHIFTPGKLNDFIKKYQINSEDQYALMQLYNYRVIRPSDANMDRTQREEFYSFMKNRKHRDFLHFCSQNNVTPEDRVIKIEAHIDFLSDKQREQLTRIKENLKVTPGKLKHYFHWLLIKIQQFITFMKDKVTIISKDSKQESSTETLQVNDRNKTEGEQQKTEEVAATEKKDPEDISFQDITRIATFWNIMANGREMDLINSLTNNKIESIYNLVKSHGKDNVLIAIENTGNLFKEDHMISVITLKDFMFNSEQSNSRFNKVLKRINPDTRFTKEEQRARGDKKYKFYTTYSVVAHDNIPQFNSKAEAKSWFKSNLNQM